MKEFSKDNIENDSRFSRAGDKVVHIFSRATESEAVGRHPLADFMPRDNGSYEALEPRTEAEWATAGLEARLSALGFDPDERAGQISSRGGTIAAEELKARILSHS